MNGYMDRILHVDLSQGRLWDEPVKEDDARDFAGGSGLAARIVCDMVNSETDPLGPQNPLIFMTGPLVGTAMPSSGRYSVCALSPLTGIWGEANSGGFFGPELRFAGYDGVVVTGCSDTPVWLSIVDGQAQLHDASGIWGSDSYRSQELVRAALGDQRARVACIGVGGENRVKMAAVMNDHGRAAGRTGMGAVMGSKRLKAIGVRGQARVPLSEPERLKTLAREIITDLEDAILPRALRLAGTAGTLDALLMYGDMSFGYYQRGDWDKAGNLSGLVMAEQYQNKVYACYRCPIACGRETKAPRYGLDRADGPEAETIFAFGHTIMVDDLQAIIYSGHLCNLYGVDTVSTGCTIALACEMFQRGIISGADTGGIEIRYGDVEVAHRLIEMIGCRRGFGDVLAEGSAAVAERFGVPQLAVTVKRLEVPMHDARAFTGMAVTYALSPCGASHMQGDMYAVDMGQCEVPEIGLAYGDRFESSEEKGRVAARVQAWRNLYNSLTLCHYQDIGMERMLTALKCTTGWELSAGELLNVGKRIVALKRLLNMRRGVTGADDKLPSLLLAPLKEGGTEGNVPHMDVLLRGAYAELGWDPDTGRPTPETITRLGLDWAVKSR